MDYGAPSSYMVLEQGVDVISSDGDEVGVVEHVLADEEENIFDGIVVDSRLGPGGLVFVDASQVAEVYEKAVLLSIDASAARALPKPSANRQWVSIMASKTSKASFDEPGTRSPAVNRDAGLGPSERSPF